MAYNGTPVGSPTYQAGATGFGQEIVLNGTSQYVSIPPAVFPFGPGDSFTVEMLVATAVADDLNVAFGLYGDDGTTVRYANAGVNGGAPYAAVSGVNGGAAVQGGSSIADGGRHWLTLVYAPGTLSVYADGTRVNTGSGTFDPPVGTLSAFVGGWTTSGAYWPGTIDEVRVSNVARYSGPSYTVPSGPLTADANTVALYHLNGDASDAAGGGGGGSATAFTVSGPLGGGSRQASAPFTVTPVGGNYTGTVTPSDGGAGGTFSPASLTWSGSAAAKTCTYTPGSKGGRPISFAASPALGTPPAAIAFYALPAQETDATGPAYGQNLSVLAPNADAAAPYSSGAGAHLLLMMHGAGETVGTGGSAFLGSAAAGASVPAAAEYAAMVAGYLDAGYIVAKTNAHGDNWGDDASLLDQCDAYRYCAASYSLLKTLIWCGSMGGLDGMLSVTGASLPNVVGVVAVMPVCSLSAAYTGGGGGTNFSASVNAAYGITGSGGQTYANLTLGHDPLLQPATAWRGVPVRFYASPDDVTVVKSVNTDPMAALLSGSVREAGVVPTTGAHGSADHYSHTADQLAFFARCVAAPPPTSGQPGVGPVRAAFRPSRAR